jgi:hypothetical protein
MRGARDVLPDALDIVTRIKNPDRGDCLLASVILANGARGHSPLQLSRDLDCPFKTVFVLAHNLREAIGANARRMV